MISVPILVTLTDRLDAKHVYLFGVAAMIAGHLLFALVADGFWTALATRALTGMGWAGTYMTGLKLLADQVDAKQMSRATAGHAGEHRDLRRAIVCLRGPVGGVRRLENRFPGGWPFRHGSLDHRGNPCTEPRKAAAATC
jgi:hypothetical protein